MKVNFRKSTIVVLGWVIISFQIINAEAGVKDLSRITPPPSYTSEWSQEEKTLYLENEDGSLRFEIGWYAQDINNFNKIFDKPIFLKTWVEEYCQSMGLTAERYQKQKLAGKTALDIIAKSVDVEEANFRHRIVFFAFKGEVYYIFGVSSGQNAASASLKDAVFEDFLKQF